MLAANFLSGSFLSSLPGNSVFHSERLLVHRHVLGNRALFINAQPDLFIITDDENIIVDFKTDRYFSKDRYAMQLALYINAVEGLNKKSCRAFLCFLRSGDMVQSGLKKSETSELLEKLICKEL